MRGEGMSKTRLALVKGFSVIATAVILSACGESKVFTEIDYSFDKLSDLFPQKFDGAQVEFFEEQPTEQPQLKVEDFLMGGYGSKASFKVWQFKKKDRTKSGWKKIVDYIRSQQLSQYNNVSSTEKRFDYTYKNGIVGMVWTNKSFLFQTEAKNAETLKMFLRHSRVAKVQ